jgi:hypothetical protein
MHLHFKHQIARVPSAVGIWLKGIIPSTARNLFRQTKKKARSLGPFIFKHTSAITAGRARGPALNRSLVEDSVWSFHATAPRGPGVVRLRCHGECFPPAVAPEDDPGDLASPAAAVRTAGSAAEPGFC